MALEQLGALIETARKEVTDVEAADGVLSDARADLQVVQDQVAGKQAEVDAARDRVATEKAEAITALRAISDAIQAEIAKLESPA